MVVKEPPRRCSSYRANASREALIKRADQMRTWLTITSGLLLSACAAGVVPAEPTSVAGAAESPGPPTQLYPTPLTPVVAAVPAAPLVAESTAPLVPPPAPPLATRYRPHWIFPVVDDP
jgi:hypothetical protein